MAEMLDDGAWHDGARIFSRMQRAIPPGAASRKGRQVLKDPDEHAVEEVIRAGRRYFARSVIADSLSRGVIEADVDPLTRAHWSGQEPFRIRAVLAGAVSLEEAAEMVGISRSTIRTWVRNEYIPVSTSGGGVLRMTPDQIAILRRVREIWPGPGQARWPVDPRTVWDPNHGAPEGFKCPHCGESVTVTLGKT